MLAEARIEFAWRVKLLICGFLFHLSFALVCIDAGLYVGEDILVVLVDVVRYPLTDRCRLEGHQLLLGYEVRRLHCVMVIELWPKLG